MTFPHPFMAETSKLQSKMYLIGLYTESSRGCILLYAAWVYFRAGVLEVKRQVAKWAGGQAGEKKVTSS